MTTMRPLAILKSFFGYKDGQELKGFAEEIKQLNETEKKELVTLAAEKLGVEVEWTGPLA